MFDLKHFSQSKKIKNNLN